MKLKLVKIPQPISFEVLTTGNEGIGVSITNTCYRHERGVFVMSTGRKKFKSAQLRAIADKLDELNGEQ